MSKFLKFIPGPNWPQSTMGSKLICPDGTEIPNVCNVRIEAPAGEQAKIVVETMADISELSFLPESVAVFCQGKPVERQSIDGSTTRFEREATIADCLGLIPSSFGVTAEQIQADLNKSVFQPSEKTADSLYAALSAGLDYQDALIALPHLDESLSLGGCAHLAVLTLMVAFGVSARVALINLRKMHHTHGNKAFSLVNKSALAVAGGFTVEDFTDLMGAPRLRGIAGETKLHYEAGKIIREAAEARTTYGGAGND